MFKKIAINILTRWVSTSSGYTVPQGKVFILTGIMSRKRTYPANTNSGDYEWGYSKNHINQNAERTQVYISNQLGSGFKFMIMWYWRDQYYEVNNIKWKFFLEGETIFGGAYFNNDGDNNGEITILWEEIDNT